MTGLKAGRGIPLETRGRTRPVLPALLLPSRAAPLLLVLGVLERRTHRHLRGRFLAALVPRTFMMAMGRPKSTSLTSTWVNDGLGGVRTVISMQKLFKPNDSSRPDRKRLGAPTRAYHFPHIQGRSRGRGIGRTACMDPMGLQWSG